MNRSRKNGSRNDVGPSRKPIPLVTPIGTHAQPNFMNSAPENYRSMPLRGDNHHHPAPPNTFAPNTFAPNTFAPMTQVSHVTPMGPMGPMRPMDNLRGVQILDPSIARVGPTLSAHAGINAPSPMIASTPPVIASTPPVIASTPPVIASTSPAIASTPPVIASTPPVIASETLSVNDELKSSTESRSVAHHVSATRSTTLVHYHITGGKGWQRLFGYSRGTDIQPIQIINPATIYRVCISHSGIGSIPVGSAYLCKNMVTGVVPTAETEAVVGIIHFHSEILKPINIILKPGDKHDDITWETKSVQLAEGDQLSMYSDNLSGSNIELYLSSES